MLRIHALIARAVALGFCLATTACADIDDEHAPSMLTPEVEEPLSLSVDDLDVRHGSLRIEASMLEGSADVSVWLGPSCPEQEVGRGIATRSALAWSLSAEDVGRAIACNLVVKARGINEDGLRVVKTAALDVSISLVTDEESSAQLLSQQTDGDDTTMSFATEGRASYLHIGGSVIGAADEAEDADEDAMTPNGLHVSSFIIGNTDLARSLLRRGHVTVRGEHFLTTVTVGSTTLDLTAPTDAASLPAEPVSDGSPEVDDEIGDG